MEQEKVMEECEHEQCTWDMDIGKEIMKPMWFVQPVCFISKRILLKTIQALGNLQIKSVFLFRHRKVKWSQTSPTHEKTMYYSIEYMSNYVHVSVSNKWKTVTFVTASTVVRLVPECAHWFGMREYFFFCFQGHLTQTFHTITVEIIDKYNLGLLYGWIKVYIVSC